MGDANKKRTMVSSGKLQVAIRGIKLLPQHRRIARESKER